MSTFLLNSANDLALREGQLVLETDEVIAQGIDLYQKFQLFLGEWFLDVRQGIPYLELVYVKAPDLQLLKRLFTSILLSSPIVSEVTKMEVFYNPRERVASFVFEARADDGRTISGGPGQPFIVSGE